MSETAERRRAAEHRLKSAACQSASRRAAGRPRGPAGPGGFIYDLVTAEAEPGEELVYGDDGHGGDCPVARGPGRLRRGPPMRWTVLNARQRLYLELEIELIQDYEAHPAPGDAIPGTGATGVRRSGAGMSCWTRLIVDRKMLRLRRVPHPGFVAQVGRRERGRNGHSVPATPLRTLVANTLGDTGRKVRLLPFPLAHRVRAIIECVVWLFPVFPAQKTGGSIPDPVRRFGIEPCSPGGGPRG